MCVRVFVFVYARAPPVLAPPPPQYTSGSTSEPKGVMITHANLAHNLHTITTALAAVDDTVVVSWLPQCVPPPLARAAAFAVVLFVDHPC